MHINGIDNKVVDCLSHFYENDMSDDNHLESTYVKADIRLDPDGELLLTDHYTEVHTAATRQSKHLAKRQQSHHSETEILNASDKELPPSENTSSADDVTTIAAGNDGKPLSSYMEETMDLQAITKNAYCKDMICIPWDAFRRGRRLIEIIIDHAHQIIGHYGQWKMLNYI